MIKNPILRGVNPDPSICRVGEDYYLATSSFYLIPGVPIYHSRDLVNWRLLGHALTRREQFNLDNTNDSPEIYAPTLRYHDGVFYIITTNVHGGGNFYVTATNPAGTWSDPIFIDGGAFDPSLFFDDDGKVYYTRRGPFDTKDIVQAEIDIKTGKLLSPLRSISLGMVSDDAEGPHLYKINGWYYLMIAEGGTMYLHMETIGRSRSPWGPFESCPWNPILSQHHAWWHPVRSTGHADLIQAHDGSWWMVFLATRHASYPALNILGRESFLAPVSWQDGWPAVDPRAMRQLNINAPTLPPNLWESVPVLDDFSSTQLRPEWVFVNFPQPGIFSLTDRPGYLRLWGQSSLPNEGNNCAFIGRRQTSFHSEAETVIDFSAASRKEEAGLCVFMRHEFQYNFAVTQRAGRNALILRKRVGDINQTRFLRWLSPGTVRLKIQSQPNEYTFSFSQEGGKWQVVGSAQTRLLCTDLAQTWAGLLIGIYASGNGKPNRSPADFKYFRYQPIDKDIEPFY